MDSIQFTENEVHYFGLDNWINDSDTRWLIKIVRRVWIMDFQAKIDSEIKD